MASSWGASWLGAWADSWGVVGGSTPSAEPTPARGGGYPDGLPGSGKREREETKRARRASEERRYKRLKKLDEALEEAWLTLNPSERVVVEEDFQALPEAIRPPDVRIADLPRAPVIDLEAAALTSSLYRDAVTALERAIELRRKQMADEEDVEILLLASL
jgi:hypothetical protein